MTAVRVAFAPHFQCEILGVVNISAFSRDLGHRRRFRRHSRDTCGGIDAAKLAELHVSFSGRKSGFSSLPTRLACFILLFVVRGSSSLNLRVVCGDALPSYTPRRTRNEVRV